MVIEEAVEQMKRQDLIWVNVGTGDICPEIIHGETGVEKTWKQAGYFSKMINDERYVMPLSTHLSLEGEPTGNYQEMGRDTFALLLAKWAAVFGNDKIFVNDYLPQDESEEI